jgi:fatty acid-binding protein DegV
MTSPLEVLRNKVYAYLIPRDLYFVHARGKKKGEKSISWLSYKIGSMMDVKPIIEAHRGETQVIGKATGFDASLKKLLEHAMRQIKQGLATPVVAISYAGDLRDMDGNPLINQFIQYAERHDIQVLISVMSVTAAINVGAGSLSLAFAAA